MSVFFPDFNGDSLIGNNSYAGNKSRLCICIPYLLYMHVKHKEHDYPFVPFLTVGYFIVYFISEKAGL